MKKPDPLDYGAYRIPFLTVWPKDSRKEEYLKDFEKWKSLQQKEKKKKEK